MLSVELAATPNRSDEIYHQGWQAHDRGDFIQAFQLWLPLAQQGHITAQINIGVMYDYGKGVPQDFESAAKWYRAAAHQGHAVAQYNLGVFLSGGKVANGGEEGLYWLLKAADQGYADAQFKLGLSYLRGEAGREQTTAASQWLYQAGLNYLSVGDGDGAMSAASALKQIDSSHQLASELDARLAKKHPTQ